MDGLALIILPWIVLCVHDIFFVTVIKLAVILFVVGWDCSDVVYTGILQKLYGIRLAFLEMLGARQNL